MKLKDTDKILEELTKIKDKKRKDNAEAFVNNQLDISYWLNAQATQLEDVIRLIEEAPTEEERPQNKWIVDEFGRKICGKCQFPFAEFQSNNYCSLCGADMRKGEEENNGREDT